METDFQALVRQIAETEEIPESEAIDIAAEREPELYERYRQSVTSTRFRRPAADFHRPSNGSSARATY